MRIADAEAAFRGHLASLGLTPDGTDAKAVIDAMLGWYESVRVEDAAALEDDGDMLLFQWGPFDAGSGRVFEVGLTRQFIGSTDTDDDEIGQLSMNYRYSIDDQTDALGSGSAWCASPSALAGFRRDIDAHPASAVSRTIRPLDARLAWEMTG